MKISSLSYVLFGFFLLSVSCLNKVDFSSDIEAIGKKYVPDKSVGVFSVSYYQKDSKIILKGETDNAKAHQELISVIQEKGFQVIDSINVLPKEAKYPWGLITLSVANVRTVPSQDAELSTQLLMGTPVKILKEEGGWFLVQGPDQYIGWCEDDALGEKEDAVMEQWQKSDRVFVTSMYANVLDSASNMIVSDLVGGCILQKTGSKNNYYFVQLPDGRKGKIPVKDVVDFAKWSQSVELARPNLIQTAEKFMGLPYLWGGASTKACDCSGFVKTVYFLNGYVLKRDANQQATCGRNISIDSLWKSFEPGDLIFFGKKGDTNFPDNVKHVGMYIGNTEFIHASGRVKINSLDSSKTNYIHYKTVGLKAARRICGEKSLDGIVRISEHPWYFKR